MALWAWILIIVLLVLLAVLRWKAPQAGPVGMFLGDVDVTSQVVSYQRRRIATGEVIDTRPLDLPTRELRTVPNPRDRTRMLRSRAIARSSCTATASVSYSRSGPAKLTG